MYLYYDDVRLKSLELSFAGMFLGGDIGISIFFSQEKNFIFQK
jgi:hypothetical protein